MLVFEMLSPTERTVFVLREVFDVGYDEIATAVGKSPAAVRQIAHRARRHVDARRPREVVFPGETRAAMEAFQRALETGNPQGLLDALAPEVVYIADGGGVKQAALQPVIGAERVVRMVVGGPDRIDGVVAIRVEDARITGLYYVRNPKKPTRVTSETLLTRQPTPEV